MFNVVMASSYTYRRESKKGHPDHTESGSQQATIPCLGNLITIANGGKSDLVKG